MAEYRVNTSFNHERIEQELLFVHGNIIDRIQNQVVLLQDQGVREALIALGWTPPKVGSRSGD